MANREPIKRGREPEMDLPEGKTCKDCVHFERCYKIYGHIADDESCDWAPSRFRERVSEEEKARQAKVDASVKNFCVGVSSCCESPLNTSQVITSGRYKNHGPRYCSKCGQLAFLV